MAPTEGFSLKPPGWLFKLCSDISGARSSKDVLDLIVDPVRYDTPTVTSPMREVDRLTAETFHLD